jgi:hypothetical protein
VISTISVDLSSEEYCKYDPLLSVFNAAVTTDGTSGDTLTWTISRLDGFGTIATGNIILSGPNTSIVVDLRGVLDPDGINWITAGSYNLNVAGGTANVDVTFLVSLIPVEEFKRRWIFGLSLEASDILAPVVPLRIITGVTYEDSSQTMPPGAYTLLFTPGSPATLSLDGGTSAAIFPTGIQHVVLVESCNSAWVKFRVDPARLPVGVTSEVLVLDRAKMDDESLREFITAAAHWVESYLQIGIEPRVSMTPLLWNLNNRPFVDSLTQAVSWQRPYQTDTWLSFHLPVRRLLKVYKLQGYFNSSLSVDIPVDMWETHDEYSGMVVFIPRSGGALVAWQSVQATFFQFMFARDVVQEFWNYDVAHGLRSLDIPENAPIIEAVARKAAIDVLLQAGSALKAGISSESVSRDGVSESTSYTQSAMYGIYSHVTIPYQDWLDSNLPMLKRRLGGVSFVTL